MEHYDISTISASLIFRHPSPLLTSLFKSNTPKSASKLQSTSTSNSPTLQITHLTVTAGSWGADGISRGALIPSGGAFFTTSQSTLQSQIRKKKRKRTFLPKPPRNQAKFAPTSPRVDTSVCANTAKGASFPPTPGFRKNHQTKKKLQQRKTTEIPPTSPPRDQNTRHHGIARRTPRKAL